MNPEISVIVPVYNTEKYLCRCIDSILSQAFTDFEVLLIDDGSSDKSSKICDEYAQKDKRVRVFHKENGGVSSARNLGLDNAKGEYITFVDSDDWIEKDVITKHLFDNKSDVIQIPRNRGSLYKTYSQDIICTNRQEVVIFLDDNYYNECWGRFYKSTVISSVRFDTDVKMGEDILFFVQIYKNIHSYYVKSGKKGYYYFENETSSSSRLGYFCDLDKLTQSLITIIKKDNNRIAWRFLLTNCCKHNKNRGTYKQFVYGLGYWKLKRAPVGGLLKGQILYDKKQFLKEDIVNLLKFWKK